MRTTRHKTHVIDDTIESYTLLATHFGWQADLDRVDLIGIRKDVLVKLNLLLIEAIRKLEIPYETMDFV